MGTYSCSRSVRWPEEGQGPQQPYHLPQGGLQLSLGASLGNVALLLNAILNTFVLRHDRVGGMRTPERHPRVDLVVKCHQRASSAAAHSVA